MFQLDLNEFEIVRPLFRVLKEHLIVDAVIDGSSLGKIYTDSKTHPTAAFLYSVEGSFLVGKPNSTFALDLCDLIFSHEFQENTIREGEEGIDLAIHPGSWRDYFDVLFKRRKPFTTLRRHYICKKVIFDWKSNIQEGYILNPIDTDLLTDKDIEKPSHITEWIKTNWGSIENYIENGFGFCLLYKGNIASWSLADCYSGTKCEIGIRTHENYRRKGLATIVASTTTAFALEKYEVVGWHCNEDNLGSWGVAEKVGFILDNHYTFYYVYFDEAKHLAVKGWEKFQEGYFKEATTLYEEASSISELPANFYHAIARAYAERGENKKAIEYINHALDRGFRDVDFTLQCESFKELKNTSEWKENILRRIKELDL